MRHAQLRAFHNVALLGGFSRAAEHLNMTQPSISDQVKRLEQTYDVLLFDRGTRHVTLTDAGTKLFRLTREYFEMEDQIADTLNKTRAAIRGELRIIADSAVHITPSLTRFRQAHPGIFVSIRAGNTEKVLAGLRAYEAEVGVVGNMNPAPDIDLIDLGWTPVIAVSKAGYFNAPVAGLGLSDLARLPLVFREPGSRTRSAIETLAREQGISLRPSIVVEGREAMREVVASGAGVGFLSDAEFGQDPRLRKIAITDANPGMQEAVVTLKARRDVAAIRAFVAQVRKV